MPRVPYTHRHRHTPPTHSTCISISPCCVFMQTHFAIFQRNFGDVLQSQSFRLKFRVVCRYSSFPQTWHWESQKNKVGYLRTGFTSMTCRIDQFSRGSALSQLALQILLPLACPFAPVPLPVGHTRPISCRCRRFSMVAPVGDPLARKCEGPSNSTVHTHPLLLSPPVSRALSCA